MGGGGVGGGVIGWGWLGFCSKRADSERERERAESREQRAEREQRTESVLENGLRKFFP